MNRESKTDRKIIPTLIYSQEGKEDGTLSSGDIRAREVMEILNAVLSYSKASALRKNAQYML